MAEVKLVDSSECIRSLREQAGIELSRLSETIGVHKSTLNKMEQGKLGISLPLLDKISEALDTKPELIIMLCFKAEYPSLMSKSLGRELRSIIEQIR